MFFTQGTKTVTTLSSTASQEVTLNFDMSDYEDGMIVNVVLDGFTPVDDALKPLATRESVNYTYEPNPKQSGRHSITLKTEAGATECNVTLSVKGMTTDEYQWGNGTLTQSDIKTAQITCSIAGTLSGTVDYKKNDTYSVTITVGDYSTTVTGNKITQSDRKYTYSFNLTRWTINYSQPTDVVTVRMNYKSGSKNYYSNTCTVQELLGGNITGLQLVRE